MSDRRLLAVIGPNGSGKSSIVISSGIAEDYGENIINPDNYAKGVSDIEDITERYIFAMKQCELLRGSLLEHGISFGFETVGSTDEKIDFLKKAASKGYKIEILFVTTESAELCAQRVRKRVERGGHDVEMSKIFSRYERTMDRLKDYIDVADEAYVYDNSGESPTLVFTKKNGIMRMIEEPSEIPWAEKYIHRHYKDIDKTLILHRKKN
ncbi:MAG: zeta toxin family protein [Methanomassiliicoccaceae archaeon]|nr:zeta toxin family protein [Methanomassiliicoccaceae archaeon]